MSGPVQCFLVVRTSRAWVRLRRWTDRDTRPCSAKPGDYCHAAADVGTVDDATGLTLADDPIRYPHDAAPWPRACERCGRAFADDDTWQVFYDDIYVRADGAPGEYSIRSLPPGAMYDATWLDHMRGPDGRSLILMLPDGRPWHIDGPSTNGNGWTRTGDAPRVTARPSILTPGYHGWLTDGVLSPC